MIDATAICPVSESWRVARTELAFDWTMQRCKRRLPGIGGNALQKQQDAARNCFDEGETQKQGLTELVINPKYSGHTQLEIRKV